MAKPFFSWRQAVLESNLQATTRHVLLTLGCHMNDVGESCFPSIETLCHETGLSNKTVIEHIKVAKEAGFISVNRAHKTGKEWARNEYRIQWPETVENGSVAATPPEKAVNLAPKAVNLTDEGSVIDGEKAVYQLHTSTSVNSTVNSTRNSPSSAGVNPAPELVLTTDEPTLNQRTWTAYEGAYRKRYKVPPVRNAKVNGQLAQLGKRLGVEAPAVAEFYLYHNGSFYVRAKHTVDLLLRDCEGIRTEWATGKIVTQGEAQQMDRKQGNYNAVQEVIARRAARGQL
jgi:hypothetical protein